MRNARKLISLMLAATMLFAANVINAYAVDAPKLKLIGTTGGVGDTVSVDLLIENNPGITAFSIMLAYPSDSLELIGVEASGDFTKGFSNGKLTANPFKISWYNNSSEDVYTNGKIATYSFRIIKLDEPAELSISYRANDVFNSSFENRYFETENAYISPVAHNYRIVSFSGGVATLECSDCGETKTEAFADHINERGYAPLDVVADGIINAKDFAYLLKNF